MVAVLSVPETYPWRSPDEKHSSKFCKSLLVICQKRVAARARSVLPRWCPGRQHLCCVPGAFFFPHGHDFHWGWSEWLTSCQARAGTRFLEETGVEAEPDSQSLIYLEKLLLKALCAVNTDSAVWRCQNCSFLLTSFPKCSYCILQIRASDLQFLMPVLFRPQDGDFPVPLGFPMWSYGCGFLSAPSFPLSVLLSPYTLQQHLADHQRMGGRLPRVTLSSPIFAPFLLHHNPFSLSKL